MFHSTVHTLCCSILQFTQYVVPFYSSHSVLFHSTFHTVCCSILHFTQCVVPFQISHSVLFHSTFHTVCYSILHFTQCVVPQRSAADVPILTKSPRRACLPRPLSNGSSRDQFPPCRPQDLSADTTTDCKWRPTTPHGCSFQTTVTVDKEAEDTHWTHGVLQSATTDTDECGEVGQTEAAAAAAAVRLRHLTRDQHRALCDQPAFKHLRTSCGGGG